MNFLYKYQQTMQSLSTLGQYGFCGHVFTVRRFSTASGALGKTLATSDTTDTSSTFCPYSPHKESLSTAAKPFKAIPGPKPLPFIWNIWRYFPLIGKSLVSDFLCQQKYC